MTWSSNPDGRGTGRTSDGWMRQFLRREAEAQTAMLLRLRERLDRDLDKLDREKIEGVPGKEWRRAAKLYIDGYRTLAQLELETARLRLLAQRQNEQRPLSDDEYEREIGQLGREAVKTLTDEEFQLEAERRRSLPAPKETR